MDCPQPSARRECGGPQRAEPWIYGQASRPTQRGPASAQLTAALPVTCCRKNRSEGRSNTQKIIFGIRERSPARWGPDARCSAAGLRFWSGHRRSSGGFIPRPGLSPHRPPAAAPVPLSAIPSQVQTLRGEPRIHWASSSRQGPASVTVCPTQTPLPWEACTLLCALPKAKPVPLGKWAHTPRGSGAVHFLLEHMVNRSYRVAEATMSLFSPCGTAQLRV